MVLLTLLVISQAQADTWEVCASSSCDYTAIQLALDSASSGDTVLVQPGTWREDLYVHTPVTLVSTDGADLTTLEGVYAESVVVLGEAGGSTLSGFTIVPRAAGRGVEVLGQATLSELVISGSSDHYFASNGGGIFVEAGVDTEVVDVSLDNLDSSSGGGLYASGTVEATGLMVKACSATSGGAVAVHSLGSFQCTGCSFVGNVAYGALFGWGGAVYSGGGPIFLESSSLVDNTAEVWGGHVGVGLASSLTIADSTLSGGESSQSGGGLYALTVGAVTLSGNTWASNTALGEGNAEGRGGHAVLAYCGTSTVSGDLFIEGDAASAGGALWVESSDLSISYSRFENNQATTGGAIYFHGVLESRSLLRMDHSELVDNGAEEGGGLYVESNLLTGYEPDDVLIYDTLVQGNTADTGAGLMVLGARRLELVRSSLCDNRARLRGGAVYLHEGGPRQERHLLSNDVFVGNVATDYGADLYTYGQELDLVHSTFLGSDSGTNGSVYLGYSTVDFTHNLLAWHQGGAALLATKGLVDVEYVAWFDNALDLGGDLAELASSGAPTLYFDADPRFYDLDPTSLCEPAPFHPDGSLYDAGDPWVQDLDDGPSDLGAHSGPDALIDLWWDDDGDHWARIYDCAPDDGTVHPYTDEHCDGVDEDCDRAVDEDPVDPLLWYADTDGDGFGDPASTQEACEAPGGWVSDATDCDDTRSDTFPGAPEVWYDGEDQDCAGDSDFDQDGDGFDSDQHGGADCLDTDPDLHPDASDPPDDGLDQDCDGSDSRTAILSGGCGCGPGGRAPLWLVLMLSALALRRRTP